MYIFVQKSSKSMNMRFQIVVSPELKNCTLAGTGQGAREEKSAERISECCELTTLSSVDTGLTGVL